MGWKNLKIGELIQAVEKCQGLKAGEKMKRLCVIRVTKLNRERLWELEDRIHGGEGELVKEGFPFMLPVQFMDMFCKANKCQPHATVTRIEFEYV